MQTFINRLKRKILKSFRQNYYKEKHENEGEKWKVKHMKLAAWKIKRKSSQNKRQLYKRKGNVIYSPVHIIK